ncbi:polysaccharide biosynthesis protein [Candidatus Woesearchaeota archaeon]|nr:polysaccharide biosynthesis protein [Candidatus Woesearchaeota archaeon]
MFDNATILITGGTGSWGQELTRQLLTKYSPKEIRIYSRGEMKQVDMRLKFNNPKIKFIIGDVRDKTRLLTATKGADYVFHLAAIKHVPVCEENPEEAILTNIVGTENLVFACIENNIKKMIDVSTDKAVDPLNLYGVTKACGEKITIAANMKSTTTVFACVRGGNVLGSRGSIIPLFRKQLATTNVITVTDERMTRFIFTLEDAIGLVIKSAEESVGGEVFVMKMPSSTVMDIANCMKEDLGDKNTRIDMIGIRYGEKLDEVLVSRYEGQDRVIDDGDFFIILPFLDIETTRKHYAGKKVESIGEFNSKNTRMLNKEEVRKLLKKNHFLDPVVKEKVPEQYFH